VRLSKAQLLQKICQLPAQKQVELFSAWVGGLEPAHFSRVVELIRLENDLRQELGGARSGRTQALTEVFLKSVSHRRRNSTDMTPPQLYVYIRRRRKASESGTKYLGKLFFVPGGHTYRWREGADGSLVFYEGNVFRLTHLRTKEKRYIKLVKLDQPAPDYDYNPQPGEKPAIQVGLHVEHLHPQSLQPVKVKIYDYPSCLYEKGELSESLWQVEPVSLSAIAALLPEAELPVPERSIPLGRVAGKLDLEHPDSNSQAKRMTLKVNRAQALKILPLLRQFRDFSHWVYSSRSVWYLSEPSGGIGGKYSLTTATGKLILEFDTQDWEIVTEHSAPVLARWFYNLCSKTLTELNRGEHSDCSLAGRKLVSELFVQLQSVRGKLVEDVLKLIFQL
jgi:hypothetical protein